MQISKNKTKHFFKTKTTTGNIILMISSPPIIRFTQQTNRLNASKQKHSSVRPYVRLSVCLSGRLTDYWRCEWRIVWLAALVWSGLVWKMFVLEERISRIRWWRWWVREWMCVAGRRQGHWIWRSPFWVGIHNDEEKKKLKKNYKNLKKLKKKMEKALKLRLGLRLLLC